MLEIGKSCGYATCGLKIATDFELLFQNTKILISFWEISSNKFGKENIGNWALYRSLTDLKKSPADCIKLKVNRIPQFVKLSSPMVHAHTMDTGNIVD